MSKPRPTTRGHECGVCQDTKGRCRWFQSDADVFLCMTFADLRKGHIENGYKCLKATSGGLWATFKLDDGRDDWKSIDEKSRSERTARLVDRAIETAKLNAERKQRSLSPVERDKQYRAILAELELHADDLADLERRGFTPEEIETCGFKSVKPFQRLQGRYSTQLPGIAKGGRSLTNKYTGYLCPTVDIDGFIVALDLRLRTLPEGEKGRYRHLSSFDAVLHLFPEDGALGGELPLGVFRPPNQPLGIALAEGTGPKAFLVSQRLGLLTIGAAGGLWASSPGLFKQVLDQISTELGTKLITIYLDGGDVRNRTVMQRWQRVYTLLIEQGYSVQFAWWGQVSKGNDIDELESAQLKSITYLDWIGLETIALEEGGIEKELSALEAYQKQVLEIQRYLNTLSLPPDLELNSEFLPNDLWEKLPANGIINVRSRKASGKSKALLKPLIAQKVAQGKRVLSVTPRIVLGLEQCEKFSNRTDRSKPIFEVRWIDVLGTTQEAQANQPVGSCCWDSLWKIADQHWDVIILDEPRLGLKHLATANTAVKLRRPQILKMFKDLVHRVLSNGGIVVLCDADLTNVEVDYIRKLAPKNTPTFTIVNHHIGNSRKTEFYTGKRDGVEQLIYEHFEQMFHAGIEEPIIVAADVQVDLQAIENKLLQYFPQLAGRTVRIDSTTTEQEWGKTFVQHINFEIERIRPLLLLYSPSMEVGVSIELNWFTHIYGFSAGVIEPCEFRQLLARERHNLPLTIWAADRNDRYMSACKSPLPREIRRSLAQNIKEAGSKDIIDMAVELAKQEADGDMEVFMQVLNSMWEQGNWNNPHLELWVNIQARANFAKPQCGVQLRQELIEQENCRIYDEVSDSSKFGSEIKNQKESDRWKYAIALSGGANSGIGVEEARDIKRNSSATSDQRTQAEGVLLQNHLPGVKLTPKFIYDCKVNDAHWMSAQFLYWLVIHPEAAKALDARKWKSHLFKWQQGDVFLPDLHLKAAQVELIRELEVLSLLKDFEYSKHSEEVYSILERAKKHRWRIKRVFDLTVTEKTDPISFIGKLLQKLGLEQARVRGDGETRWYRTTGLNEVNRCAVLQAWNQKYANLVAPEELTAGESCSITKEQVSESCEERKLTAEENHFITRQQVSEPIHKTEEAWNSNGDSLIEPTREIKSENDQSNTSISASIEEAARGIEHCQTLQEFSTLWCNQFRGKCEEFFKQVFYQLSPKMQQRVIEWSG
ncbi:hypothetical protein LEP3755_65740 (plasmid) [Leptolyngbya sp. NIES-3755]|nr:hypothetical protein LEP3755_65740 [Leptolyngbya sp. NIES-3755]